jgi:hypothetical protein
MQFDALLVDVGVPGGAFDVLAGQGQPLLLLEQFLNDGDDRNIAAVYVQGRRVYEQQQGGWRLCQAEQWQPLVQILNNSWAAVGLLLLEQFLNNGDDRNIIAVYVQGRRCV